MSHAITVPGEAVMTLPPALAYVVQCFIAGEDLALDRLNTEDVAKASVLLRVSQKWAAPAEPAAIVAWMERVAISVGKNAPTEEARNAQIAMVIETCGDLPRACWTPAARVHFARVRGARSAFFPSDGEVYAVMQPYGRQVQASMWALKAVVGEQQRRAAPPPPAAPEEEIPINQLAGEARDRALAHVRGAVQGWMRSRVPEVVAVAERTRPSCLSGRALWESRNRALSSNGFPPLPEPVTFDGYGVLS